MTAEDAKPPLDINGPIRPAEAASEPSKQTGSGEPDRISSGIVNVLGNPIMLPSPPKQTDNQWKPLPNPFAPTKSPGASPISKESSGSLANSLSNGNHKLVYNPQGQNEIKLVTLPSVDSILLSGIQGKDRL